MLFQSVRLVGAVGIENNTEWNFKDLEEMLRNAKVQIRNNGECTGTLIGPSFSCVPKFRRCVLPRGMKVDVGSRSNLAVRMASR
jgi:hypothetical protein